MWHFNLIYRVSIENDLGEDGQRQENVEQNPLEDLFANDAESDAVDVVGAPVAEELYACSFLTRVFSFKSFYIR